MNYSAAARFAMRGARVCQLFLLIRRSNEIAVDVIAMAVFEVSAHMTVRPGQLEGFKKQAAECVRITKQKDTHTLRYDWFLSRDGTECEVREAYTGPEGLIEHNRNIVEARTKLFEQYADNHFMTIYGEPTPELTALVKAHHMEQQFQWFFFVRGLDSSSG